ncbi:MAG: bifunctional UDP-N-acetylglucosamine diphosphorylase/glucosamine-1-phosphate N-acetyltransferase GlmU [Pseudomonadota bacterium]
MSRTCLTVILAAGEGKRMASATPKVLHKVAGLPMVNHVINTARLAGATKTAVVVGAGGDMVREAVERAGADISTHEQRERLGTAHAVLAAREAIAEGFDDVLVLYGDVPLIQVETVQKARDGLASGADLLVLGFRTNDSHGYGRLLEENGELVAIREHKDATEEERTVDYCNSGIIAMRGDRCLEVLDAIGNDNAQKEFYLTDSVEVSRAKSMRCFAVEVPEEETLGVNDRSQLSEVETIWQSRKRHAMMLGGVALAAPETVYFSHDTAIGRDVTVEPNVWFGPNVEIADNVEIRAFSHLEGVKIASGAYVGPFARLRPGTELAEKSKVGNFCEVKATKVGEGAKINHLAYVGDATVGEKANVGAGTITCNYDGFAKHKTNIGPGAFIGSNTALVAPVSVGENANTAAGSVIHQDIEADALGIARAHQVNKPGLAKRLREKFRKLKEQRG